MTAGASKLKNVTLNRTLTRSGDDTWMLLHADGWRDPYFDYFATDLLKNKGSQFNTREKYCRFAAAFIDYLIEAAAWYRENGKPGSLTSEYRLPDSAGPALDLAGPALVELINIYPKVLAGGAHSSDPVVQDLAGRLNRKVLKYQSQAMHIAAVNHYLALSEGFNIRMHQSGMTEFAGLPLFTEDKLFPQMGSNAALSRFERFTQSNRSMLGGVLAGGPRLKRLAVLKPAVVDQNDEDHFDYDSAFPLESAPELINSGFERYRDRALYCLLMASGVRISEALALTWYDVDFPKRRIYIRNPRLKHLENVYQGYLTVEQRKKLPWKGRTHPVTLLIEPFASEFWRLLQLYMDKEMFTTSAHPFIFQVLKGPNASSPLILSDHSNLRKDFKHACRKVGVDAVYGAHSLRHMYGVYCLNFWPNADGTFGLPPHKVQFLMGHSHIESTMHYAKPDTLILEAEQRINAAILNGFAVEDRAEVRVKILGQMLETAMADARAAKRLPEKS